MLNHTFHFRKFLCSVFFGSIFIINTAFSSSLQHTTKTQPKAHSDKILIVYLSRTQNTKTIATMINHFVGGKIVAIKLVTPYPVDYQTMVDQVRDENQNDVLPPLKTHIANIKQYDTVFIGYPRWE